MFFFALYFKAKQDDQSPQITTNIYSIADNIKRTANTQVALSTKTNSLYRQLDVHKIIDFINHTEK
jgi:hypothetical protein